LRNRQFASWVLKKGPLSLLPANGLEIRWQGAYSKGQAKVQQKNQRLIAVLLCKKGRLRTTHGAMQRQPGIGTASHEGRVATGQDTVLPTGWSAPPAAARQASGQPVTAAR
jgi:hypothetical protein